MFFPSAVTLSFHKKPNQHTRTKSTINNCEYCLSVNCSIIFIMKGARKNIVNFIFIYLLGNGIRRVERNKPSSFLISQKWSLLIISFLVLCLVGFYFLPDRHNLFIHAIVFSYKYNSPFLILLSIALFNVFRTFSFDNRFINYMATSSLSIYLIHEHPLMREIIYVRPFNKLMLVESGFSLFLIIVGYALVLSFCCMGGDKIRQYVFEKISNRSDR